MYSIWATTQHYADFEAQIAGLSPNRLPTLWEDADAFLVPMYRKLLTPT
jgi:TetR/AcrR family transcriptional regulator